MVKWSLYVRDINVKLVSNIKDTGDLVVPIVGDIDG